MNWPWYRKRRNWEIRPYDLPWLGQELSFVVMDGWEPFGVSPVPNTLNPNQVRMWTRRRENTHYPFGYEIKVQQAGWGGHEVMLHLTSGWEPFALSITGPDQPIVWFRRKA